MRDREGSLQQGEATMPRIETMRWAACAAVCASTFVVAPVRAQASQPPSDTSTSSSGQPPADDPTGGAYASPTMLFIPAGALPVWNVRVIASTQLQSPSDVHAGFRPGLGGELGLPA